MTGYSAIAPGTDLSQHVRVLTRVHDAVLAGGAPPVRPRGVVARSWTRVLGLGLDASRTNAREPLAFAEVERRRRQSPLALVVDELRQVLVSVADASSFLMVVTDADGIILWREGSPRVRLRADSLGFMEGARWTEATVGTNAIGTALAEAAPVQLFSAEHFEQAQHPRPGTRDDAARTHRWRAAGQHGVVHPGEDPGVLGEVGAGRDRRVAGHVHLHIGRAAPAPRPCNTLQRFSLRTPGAVLSITPREPVAAGRKRDDADPGHAHSDAHSAGGALAPRFRGGAACP